MAGHDGIRVERLVGSDAATLFEFLSDLENHWLLTDRFVEVLELDREGRDTPAPGGRVKVRGPLGIGRIADTRVREVTPQTRLAGTARVGDHTLARVSWTLVPEDGGTRVQLAAYLERASLVDRALLAAGGKRWIRRRFAQILATLDGRVRQNGRVPAS